MQYKEKKGRKQQKKVRKSPSRISHRISHTHNYSHTHTHTRVVWDGQSMSGPVHCLEIPCKRDQRSEVGRTVVDRWILGDQNGEFWNPTLLRSFETELHLLFLFFFHQYEDIRHGYVLKQQKEIHQTNKYTLKRTTMGTSYHFNTTVTVSIHNLPRTKHANRNTQQSTTWTAH